jgi:hypothetical protein
VERERLIDDGFGDVDTNGCVAHRESKVLARLADDLVSLVDTETTGALVEQQWGARCAAVKLDTVRTAARGALECAARNQGPSATRSCTARAARMIRRRFRAAEIRIGCTTIGDAGTVVAALERFVGEATAAVAPAVDFATTVQPIFTARCASTSACHAGPAPSLHLDLSAGAAWSNLVGVPSVQCGGPLRVDPVHPTESYLITKLEHSFGPQECRDSEQMPPGATLSPHELSVILNWVLHGAPHD